MVVCVKNLGPCGWMCVCDEQIIASQLKLHLFHMKEMPYHHRNGFYLVCNGKILADNDAINSSQSVYIVPRVFGGKGGFGSMLRAIGAQIEKTTNREACRDLSGRRLRDINEEMRLKKWITKQAEREQEKVARNRERLERRLATPKHEFSDPEYDKQRSELGDKVNDALNEGLTVVKSVKRFGPSEEGGNDKKKKPRLWVDLDEDELSDDNSDSSEHADSLSSNSDSESKEMTPEKEAQLSKPFQIDDCQPSTSMTQTCALEIKNETQSKVIATNIQVGEILLDLEEFDSVQKLEDLGLDRLKFALMARGMKCGGTLQQRAERLISIRGVAQDEIDPTLLVKKQIK